MGTREYDEEGIIDGESWNSISSRGWDDAGWWTPGTYRVEILINGVKFAEGWFTINDERSSGSQLVTANLDLESLRFFESGKLATGERQYSTSFPQRTTCFVNFEITMRNRLHRQKSEMRAKTCNLKFDFFKPDGGLMWGNQRGFCIVFDKDRHVYAEGCGWREPGWWTPGTYRVVILIDEVKFTEGSFTITGSKGRSNSNGG